MIRGTERFIVNPEQKFTEAAVTKDEKEKCRKRKKKKDEDERDM